MLFRSALKSLIGNSASRHLVSCRQRTSGARLFRKCATSGIRSRTELMFQVVIFTISGFLFAGFVFAAEQKRRDIADAGSFFGDEGRRATHRHRRKSDARGEKAVEHAFAKLGGQA